MKRRKAKDIEGSVEGASQIEDNGIEDDQVDNDVDFQDSELDLSEDDDREYEKFEGFNIGQTDDANSTRALYRQNEKTIHRHKELSLFEGEDVNVVEESDSLGSDSLPSDESENEGTVKSKYPKYSPEVAGDNLVFEIGMVFEDGEQFKGAIREHKIRCGKRVKFAKNSRDRIKAFCAAPNCNWYVSACKIPDEATFRVQSIMASHNCGRSFDHGGVTSEYLANKYLNDFQANMCMKLSDFQDKVRIDLNVNITKNQFYRAKEKAKKLIEGTYRDQYIRLWDYVEELRRTSPKSTIILKLKDDSNTFHRLYVCLEACRKGFLEGCRSIIGVDGCHLRGPHRGVLLTAVGMDPNDCIYPVAYAVVEAENKDSWIWFMNYVIRDLEIHQQGKWTIISDRQKGLIPAIAELLPYVEHRHCVRHLYSNFRKSHPGLALKNIVWRAARASYEAQFEKVMKDLRNFDNNAFKWFAEQTHPKHWSRSHFNLSVKCDILLNNLCESFNSVILDARERPIIWMLEIIRRYLVRRIQCKREWIEKKLGFLCPKIQKKLEVIKDESSKWAPTLCGDGEFEVENVYRERFKVNLKARTCSCRKWQLTGIPCPHAISAIRLIGQPPEQYVDLCYSRDTYLNAYKYVIPPLDGPNNWPTSLKSPVHPPDKITLPGRPKRARARASDEVGKKRATVCNLSRKGRIKIKCTICNQDGHNARTCGREGQDGTIHGPPPQSNTTTEDCQTHDSQHFTGLNQGESVEELLAASQIIFSTSPTHD